MIVGLLGGESTGKSSLARSLHNVLRTSWSGKIVLIEEHLRFWCEVRGRAPRVEEQAGIAAMQASLVQKALDGDASNVLVIADTTPMMVAAYSEQYFGDTSLWPEALAFQRRCQVSLLMGLDLPWIADGLFRDSPRARERTDAILRARLEQATLPFHTVYGQGDQRTQNALRTLLPALGVSSPPANEALEQGRAGAWSCEACSDPDCEHRLFTVLLERREAGKS
ncbi:ATP-binding protein [Hydrogenophaga sp. 5NK40-0174]|uniref:ATP-binding protein n=1 Tax=Hydrogenophaga sp. 5NK40-0174 TaxID=3127649 RepID=UPI003102920B